MKSDFLIQKLTSFPWKVNLSDSIAVADGSRYLHSPEPIIEINLIFGPSLECNLFD